MPLARLSKASGCDALVMPSQAALDLALGDLNANCTNATNATNCSASAVNSTGGNFSEAEGPEMVVDGNTTTTWLESNVNDAYPARSDTARASLVFQFASAVAPTSYERAEAPEAPVVHEDRVVRRRRGALVPLVRRAEDDLGRRDQGARRVVLRGVV